MWLRIKAWASDGRLWLSLLAGVAWAIVVVEWRVASQMATERALRNPAEDSLALLSQHALVDSYRAVHLALAALATVALIVTSVGGRDRGVVRDRRVVRR